MGLPSVSTLLLLSTALVAAVELSVVLARRPRIAMVVAIAAAAMTALAVNVSKSIGSVALTPQDFVCLSLALAIAIRVMLRFGGRPHPALLAVFAIVLFDLVRGAGRFGLQAATNESRELLYFLVAATFFSTVRSGFDFVLSLRRVLFAAAAFLTVVASVFWLQHGLGTFAANGDRALSASAALLILDATIIAVVLPLGRGSSRWLLPLVGLGVLLLSYQRTVWVAAFASFAALYLFASRVGARRARRTLSVLVAIGATAVFAALASGSDGVAKSLTSAYGSSLSSQGTFSWRTAGWAELISRQAAEPIVNVLFGNPAGTGFVRVVNGETVSVAPHSEYVTLFLTAGVLGLAILVLAYGSLFRQLARMARRGNTDTALAALAMFTLLIAEVVFFTTYSLGFAGGVLFGVSAALLRSRPDDQRAQPVETKAPQTPARRSGAGAADSVVDPPLVGRRRR